MLGAVLEVFGLILSRGVGGFRGCFGFVVRLVWAFGCLVSSLTKVLGLVSEFLFRKTQLYRHLVSKKPSSELLNAQELAPRKRSRKSSKNDPSSALSFNRISRKLSCLSVLIDILRRRIRHVFHPN